MRLISESLGSDKPGTVQFLSCLYGSEQECERDVIKPDFLSCLYGSERSGHAVNSPKKFLSCLYGSEPIVATPTLSLYF